MQPNIDNEAFLEWAAEHEADFVEFAKLVRQYPTEPPLSLLAEIFEPAPELSPAEYDIG